MKAFCQQSKYPTCFLNIPTQFGFNWQSSFRDKNVKCFFADYADNGCKVMTTPHITLCVSWWANKNFNSFIVRLMISKNNFTTSSTPSQPPRNSANCHISCKKYFHYSLPTPQEFSKLSHIKYKGQTDSSLHQKNSNSI